MKVNFNDIDFKENIKKFVDTIESSASMKNKINKEKFLIIDFKNADKDKLNLKGLDKDDINTIIFSEIFLDRYFFGEFMKYIETKNEEFLWNMLVDDNIICNELYTLNTYEENLDIMYKIKYSK